MSTLTIADILAEFPGTTASQWKLWPNGYGWVQVPGGFTELYVQANSVAVPSGDSISVSYLSTPLAGDLLLFGVAASNPSSLPHITSVVSAAGIVYSRIVNTYVWDDGSRVFDVYWGLANGLAETVTVNYSESAVDLLLCVGDWLNNNPTPYQGNINKHQQNGFAGNGFAGMSGTITSTPNTLQIGLYATAEQSGILTTDGSTIRTITSGTSQMALSDGVSGDQATASLGFNGPSGSYNVVFIGAFDISTVAPGNSGTTIAPGAYIGEESVVSGEASIGNNCIIFGQARVSGNAQILDSARVGANAIVSGNAIVKGNSYVYGQAFVTGSAVLQDFADVSGGPYQNQLGAQILGNAVVKQKGKVSGQAVVQGNGVVGGSSWCYGNCIIEGNALGSSEISYNFFLAPGVTVTSGYFPWTGGANPGSGQGGGST